MVRHKEYIREDVIDAATQVFWAKGFKGTSVSDLVSATGLNKHSMYAEFGSKEGLFRECIENFARKTNKEPNEILTRQPLGLQNIVDFFHNRIAYASSCSSFGCMLVNLTVERELIEAGAFEQVSSYLSGLEECFYNCLQAAKERGEIAESNDCRVLANFLLNVTSGIMVMSKTRPTKESLEATVKVAMSTIKK